MKEKSRMLNSKILIPVIAGVLIAIIALFVCVLANQKTTYNKIYINDTCAGKKTTEQIKAELEKVYDAEKTSLNFTYNGNDIQIKGTDFDLSYDIEKTSDKAYNLGRNKNFVLRGFCAIKYTFFKTILPVDVNFSTHKLYTILRQYTTDVKDALVDVSITLEDDKLAIINGKEGNGFDIDKIEKEAKKLLSQNKQNEKIEIKIEKVSPRTPSAEEIYDKFHKEPQNVEFGEKDGELYYKSHVTGVDFDVKEAKKILEQNKNSTEAYYIPVTITLPEKTSQWFVENMLTDTLGTYSTVYNAGNYGRSYNISLASNKIHNLVLEPGEQFSFNNVVGQRSAATGFKTAAVYQGGEIVDGIGGGICQVSSTLYNAVLYADLNIVYRTNHSMPVSYTPAGRDATVSYGSIDFIFSNNQKYPVKLSCTNSGGRLTCTVYGINYAKKKVDISTQTISTSAFETKEVEDPNLKPGERKVKQAGSNGSVVDTYKTVYVNGESQGSKKISRSVYSAITQIELVGPETTEDGEIAKEVYKTDGEIAIGDEVYTVPDISSMNPQDSPNNETPLIQDESQNELPTIELE